MVPEGHTSTYLDEIMGLERLPYADKMSPIRAIYWLPDTATLIYQLELPISAACE